MHTDVPLWQLWVQHFLAAHALQLDVIIASTALVIAIAAYVKTLRRRP
jgi:hypothetical protein